MGFKQLNHGDYEKTTFKKLAKRDKFLAVTEKVVPRLALHRFVIESHYPRTSAKGSRLPCHEFQAGVSVLMVLPGINQRINFADILLGGDLPNRLAGPVLFYKEALRSQEHCPVSGWVFQALQSNTKFLMKDSFADVIK
jgi:hypothetical protein